MKKQHDVDKRFDKLLQMMATQPEPSGKPVKEARTSKQAAGAVGRRSRGARPAAAGTGGKAIQTVAASAIDLAPRPLKPGLDQFTDRGGAVDALAGGVGGHRLIQRTRQPDRP